MEMHLKGKKVLITGASQGIGAALAAAFAREGCALTLVARSAEKLQVLANDLVARHGVTVRVLCSPAPSSVSCSRLLTQRC